MKGGRKEMFKIFKDALRIDAKKKEEMLKHMRSSMVSGMTQIMLYLA